MDGRALKEEVCRRIDGRKDELLSLVRDIGEHAELGFKEVRTSALVAEFLGNLGLPVQTGLALTGVKARLVGSSEGPTVAVLGELDGVISPDHPQVVKGTNAAHACGHNLQLGAMLGAAAGLAGVAGTLDGNVCFMGVPAEEFIEIGERMERRARGEIRFLGGKQELVAIGAFDDVDMAMMVHAGTNVPKPGFMLGKTGNGFVAKTIRYTGKATHAAAAPHEGINALNAAVIGINAVHSMRETFRDDDHVRVHFIITKGGDSVNTIPADVRLEAYVRAKSTAAIDATHAKFDRAFRSGGDAVGAKTEIVTIPGYLPLACSDRLNEVFAANAAALLSKDDVVIGPHFDASTDMGDICHIMPAIHPYFGGVTGALHSGDFRVVDFEAAVVLPAKVMAMAVIDLLAGGAEGGKDVMRRTPPLMSREEYIRNLDRYFAMKGAE
jgi:amidohydrolase